MRDAVTQMIEIAGCALVVWGVYGLLGIYAAAILAGVLVAGAAAVEDRRA